MKEGIRDFVLDLGADVCGFAQAERFAESPKGFSPIDIWQECKSVISVGVALPKGLAFAQSNLVYGYYNNDSCNIVDRISFLAAKQIEREYGATAMPIPCDGPYDYWEEETLTGKGLLSMKHVAVECGLGAIGKNSLLLNPQYGSMLIIGAVLTDLQLESDDHCKSICISGCTKCIDECPANAINDYQVNQKACRLNTFGKNKRGFATVECNNCRTICPMRFGE